MSEEEKPDAMLICSSYPAKENIDHYINMNINGSIIGQCSHCGGDVYIASGGQAVMNDPRYSVVQAWCVPCARKEHPDAVPEMNDQVRQQLVETLGDEVIAKLESEVIGTPLKQLPEDFQ